MGRTNSQEIAMRWVTKTRLIVVAVLSVAALLGVASEADAGVKAPILTFIGGAVVVTWLLPLRRPEWRDAIVVIGTAIATVGSWYWLIDATNGDPSPLVISLMGSVVLAVVLLVSVFMVWVFTRPATEPIDYNRRVIERRVRRRLHEIVDETQHAGARSPGGERYEQYDATISELFRNTWSMVNDPFRWTYAPKEHENLIDNYVVVRLSRTAEIAIGKHPQQCKYGSVAHNLSEYAKLHLYRIALITEFDPLPAECPQCKEPKPTHKSNCVAAICWQCKYPTPPQKPDIQNTNVITPQCHIPMLCFPRGEAVTPAEPIAVRVRLPFTIPEDGQDECLTMGKWPRRRKDLRNLLEELNHD